MRGIVGCYVPEEVYQFFMIDIVKAFPNHAFEYSWWYTSQTEICFRILSIPETDHESYGIHFNKFTIEVPRKIETEIWSEIWVENNEIKEVIVTQDGGKIVVEKGFEPIMKKLKSNFEKGLLNKTEYDQSVRVLKGGRIRTIFK